MTAAGRAGRQQVEDRTDALAAGPWEALGPAATDRLRGLALPLARRIAQAGAVPTISPIGDLTPRSSGS